MAQHGERVSVIVFVAGGGAAPPEQLVAGGRAAVAQDLVELALACPLVERVVVATNVAGFARRLQGYERVVVDHDAAGQAFHFGRRLLQVVEAHRIRRPLYFGGGCAPLLAPESFHALCARLLAAEHTVIANNTWSADFYGFTPAEALRRVELPAEQDNSLPFLLARFAGLRAEALEPAIENAFDVDTPTDLAVLKLQRAAKRHARRYLESAQVATERLEAVMPLLVDERAQITLIGRVNTAIWGKPTSDIPGPKRLYVEERGMRAFGRQARGQVRSLVGHLMEAVGPERLFAQLAGCSDAVLFDTRVLFHHLRLDLSAADRFASDLGDLESIGDPVARAFTAAALACTVPVVLGGHNIVAGALWALTQEAWERADAGLLA
jgi:hypothetical protein